LGGLGERLESWWPLSGVGLMVGKAEMRVESLEVEDEHKSGVTTSGRGNVNEGMTGITKKMRTWRRPKNELNYTNTARPLVVILSHSWSATFTNYALDKTHVSLTSSNPTLRGRYRHLLLSLVNPLSAFLLVGGDSR
jgi:hypothetical protein